MDSNRTMNAHIISSLQNGVRLIKFNRPQKKNAINPKMYEELTRLLNEDATNDLVVVTILTGTGDYYTSGNDITTFDESSDVIVKAFIEAFINYPKLLVAVVNGPVIGVGVTTLGLCDVVYASDRATFLTPFVDLGLCPEGCSSYVFPRILGRSKANEMLLLGHKMSSQEAFQFGLVSKVFPHEKLHEVFTKLEKYGNMPVKSLMRAKRLINTSAMKSFLHETNDQEFDCLRECFNSEEFAEAMVKKMSSMSKL